MVEKAQKNVLGPLQPRLPHNLGYKVVSFQQSAFSQKSGATGFTGDPEIIQEKPAGWALGPPRVSGIWES